MLRKSTLASERRLFSSLRLKALEQKDYHLFYAVQSKADLRSPTVVLALLR